MKEKYILVCDERGTRSQNSSSRTFIIGGFVTQENNRAHLISVWEEIKQELCGDKTVELKWSHFFPGYHQKNISNPLLSKDPDEWRIMALEALNKLFTKAAISPIATIVQKDKMAGTLFEDRSDSKKIISLSQIFGAILGQFARYLKENEGLEGEIWFDKLGSHKEQDRLQISLDELFNQIPNVFPSKDSEILARANPKIRFFDSETEPLVALADFISGTFWAASEGDEWFFNQMLENYVPGKKPTYGIVFLDA